MPRLSRTLTDRLTLTVAITAAASVSLLVTFAFWAMSLVDRQATERQVRFVGSGLEHVLTNLPVEQESAVVWDDAVLRVKADDQVWMQENLGEWMGSYFGHDSDFVLNDRDQPVHSMKDGQTVDAEAFLADAPTLSPYVEALRRDMAEASAGLADSTAAIADLSVRDIVLLDGAPAIISVRPIIPSTGNVVQAAGTEYLHIAVQRLDQTLLAEISAQYDISGLHLLQPTEHGKPGEVVPVSDAAGKILGVLGWAGDRPGLRMILEIAPGFAVALVLGGLLLGWLTKQLRQSTSDLQASEAQTQFLAFHDTLTALPNRALFDDRMERALAASRRSGVKVALHSVDIDRFKHINDTLGHPAGDELIRQVAGLLKGLVRETDTVARLGGDEFAVIQGEVRNAGDAEDLAQKIVDRMAEPFDLLGEPAFASASVGVALSNGDVGRAELLRKADIALYEAKTRGKNRFEMFVGDMDEVVKRRRLVERELRLAIEAGGQLRVVYQPLFDVDGKIIRGAEALVRWDHPVHGRLSPDLFIEIAEERGLIEPLGEWVLKEACSFAVKSGLPWVAVNVSPVQFRNAVFADKVANILEQTGLSPQRLQLEITEGVFLDSSGITNQTLNDLRETGVKIALDDFGTGYSSMSYLRQYAVDKLKIDRSFVAQLGSSRDADAIVRAMVSLARSLRLQVTAEGVETPEQLDHLAAIGCHELQGFLLSKPVGETEMLLLLGAARDGEAVTRPLGFAG